LSQKESILSSKREKRPIKAVGKKNSYREERNGAIVAQLSALGRKIVLSLSLSLSLSIASHGFVILVDFIIIVIVIYIWSIHF